MLHFEKTIKGGTVMYYRFFISIIMAGLLSACTMNISDPTQVPVNYGTNDNTGSGDEDDTPVVAALQAPVTNPLVLSSSNLSTVAVSFSLPENSPKGAEIHYTTDGSDPATSSTATVYMTPIKLSGLNQTFTIKAVAWDGNDFSTETTATYKFGDWEMVGDNYVMDPKQRYLAVENGVVYAAKRGVLPDELIIQRSVANVWSTFATASDCAGSWVGGNFVSPLAVEDGVLYIACNMGNPGVKVQKYEAGSWSTVGGANVPIEDPVDVTLKVKNGVVYLAGVDHGSWKIRAHMFNGSAWQAMGPQPLTPNSTTRIGFDVSENNIPYISYKDGALIVSKYDIATNSWINLNSGVLDMANPYSGDLKVYDDGSTEGVPYVLYRDLVGDTRIVKYSNSTWINVSSVVSSDASASIDVYLGIPYITTVDGFGKTQIKRFFNGAWENVGSATFYTPNDPQFKIDQISGNAYMYYSMFDGVTSYGFVEVFGTGGSGSNAHGSGDPFGFMF